MSREIDALVDRVCLHCKKSFKARRCYVKRGQMKYCSHPCSAQHRSVHPIQEYNGVRFYLGVQGYYQNPDLILRMHRVVWESEHGPIPDGFDIHHIDGDKANNCIENLECISHGEHSVEHNRARGKEHYQKMARARWDKCLEK